MLFHVIALLATMSRTNPYPRLAPARRDDRILIVAPHVDDEAIAAGGYVFDAIANGAEVYVVYLTAGDCARFSALAPSGTGIPISIVCVRPPAVNCVA